MAVENTKVGLEIGLLNGTKVNVRCYQGPDNDSAAAAYLACKEISDALQFNRTTNPKGVQCGPTLPYRNPSGQP